MTNFKHIARTHEQHLSQLMATKINHAKSGLPFDHGIYQRHEIVKSLLDKEYAEIIDYTGTIFHLDGSITIRMYNRMTGKKYIGFAQPMPIVLDKINLTAN